MTEVEAIHHITEATMADDPKKAVKELDRAAELIDEMAARLAQESKGEDDEPEPNRKARVRATASPKRKAKAKASARRSARWARR
jgi:hypothetical protein